MTGVAKEAVVVSQLYPHSARASPDLRVCYSVCLLTRDTDQPIEATLLSLAIVFVFARLFLRLVRQRQKLTLSDWILIASLCDAIALFTTDAMAYNLGGMDEYDPKAPEPPVADQIKLMKVSFAGNYFYDTGIYIPKLAMLAFYFKLIPKTMPLLRKALYGVSALTLTFAVTTCFLDTFWCGPNVSVNWDLKGTCSTFDSKDVFRIDWVLNFISDLLSKFPRSPPACDIAVPND